jgi:hypothetical protein
MTSSFARRTALAAAVIGVGATSAAGQTVFEAPKSGAPQTFEAGNTVCTKDGSGVGQKGDLGLCVKNPTTRADGMMGGDVASVDRSPMIGPTTSQCVPAPLEAIRGAFNNGGAKVFVKPSCWAPR